jgi:hypothetical protein
MKKEIFEDELTVSIKVTIPPRIEHLDKKLVVNSRDALKLLIQSGYNNISHVTVGEHVKISNANDNNCLTHTWQFAKLREVIEKKEKVDAKPTKTRRTRRTRKKD